MRRRIGASATGDRRAKHRGGLRCRGERAGGRLRRFSNCAAMHSIIGLSLVPLARQVPVTAGRAAPHRLERAGGMDEGRQPPKRDLRRAAAVARPPASVVRANGRAADEGNAHPRRQVAQVFAGAAVEVNPVCHARQPVVGDEISASAAQAGQLDPD